MGQRVRVLGREDLEGIVGTTPVHLIDPEQRGKNPEAGDLAVDVGLPAERVRELVRPGDRHARTRSLRAMGDLLTGKSIDDRVGVFVMLEALRAAGPSTAHVDRLGHRAGGGRPARRARRGRGAGAPGRRPRHRHLPRRRRPRLDAGLAPTRLGLGTAVRVMDASAIGSPALVNLLVRLATEREIPHQLHVANRGGTDTQSIQLAGDGAVAGCVSIPTRYGHSSVEACHPADVEASIRLVAGLIERVGDLAVPA